MNRAKQVKFYLDLLLSLKAIADSAEEELILYREGALGGNDETYYKDYLGAKVRLHKFKARAQRELSRG